MLQIELDRDYVESVFRQELKKRLDQLQNQTLFWDVRELERQTNMSINTMKEHFFYDDDFPKYKIGGKWYFPAEETKEFLLKWIKEES